MHTGPTLVVVADERTARFFLRSRPNMPLSELSDLAESADLMDLHGEHTGQLRKFRGKVMVKTRRQKREEELQLFVRRIAAQVDRAMAIHDCDGLAIVAPPHVLGLIRDFVSAQSRARLTLEACDTLASAGLAQVDRATRVVNV